MFRISKLLSPWATKFIPLPLETCSIFSWSSMFWNSCMNFPGRQSNYFRCAFSFWMLPMSSSALQGFIDSDVHIHFPFLHPLHTKLRLVAQWTTWTTLIIFLSSFPSCLFWGDFCLSFPLSWYFLPPRTFVCSLNIPLVKHFVFPFMDNRHSLFVNSSVRALTVYF